MRNVRLSLGLALVLALCAALPLGAYSVCVSTQYGNCVDYRQCCFYDNVTGEERGCWETWHDCSY